MSQTLFGFSTRQINLIVVIYHRLLCIYKAIIGIGAYS